VVCAFRSLFRLVLRWLCLIVAPFETVLGTHLAPPLRGRLLAICLIPLRLFQYKLSGFLIRQSPVPFFFRRPFPERHCFIPTLIFLSAARTKCLFASPIGMTVRVRSIGRFPPPGCPHCFRPSRFFDALNPSQTASCTPLYLSSRPIPPAWPRMYWGRPAPPPSPLCLFVPN